MRTHAVTTSARLNVFLCLLAICAACFCEAGDARAAGAPDYAREVIALVNKERKAAGAAALALDERLMQLAAIRAEELPKNYSHNRPDGRSWSSVLADHNYAWALCAENIAWGQSTLNTPKRVMGQWMNSPGHKANILLPNAEKIGVGVFKTPDGKYYWVQLFTVPK